MELKQFFSLDKVKALKGDKDKKPNNIEIQATSDIEE
jgi:hypothetical protein